MKEKQKIIVLGTGSFAPVIVDLADETQKEPEVAHVIGLDGFVNTPNYSAMRPTLQRSRGQPGMNDYR